MQNNLTNAERLALQKLRNNDSIVIKPADKGSATVIMDKTAYLTEAYRQLNNANYYKKLIQPIYQDNIPKINQVLDCIEAEGYISKDQNSYLRAKPSDRQRIFYLLPKIHKPISKWTLFNMPEGRPIVSDCGSESYHVSEYIDSFIRPISMKHATYIKDTYDFVEKIRGQKIPKNAILCTGDVSSLYTNMKIDRILTTTKLALENSPLSGRPDKHLLSLLEITLRNNDFTFNNEYFLQICGTAMGKTYAPALADIYLEEFDQKAMHGFKIKPMLFWRFLDDIFFVWLGSVDELKEYENYLNSILDGIKITLTYSDDKVNFLDTTVYKHYEIEHDTLLTRIYFKDTDTHQLLHTHSFHPKHTTRGVLKSQLLRFARISSCRADYDKTCEILFSALRKRNYSKSLLRKMKRDIWHFHANGIPRNKSQDEILPIVVPYNDIGVSLAKSWKTSIKNNSTFNKFRPISAYCNSSNLRKFLVHSSLCTASTNTNTNLRNRPATNPTVGNLRCTNTRCLACNYIRECTTFKSTQNNRIFKIHSKFNCKSSNIIYLITCRNCLKQYVGETTRTLGERISDHLSCIRLHKSTPVGLHFNTVGHNIKHLSICAIEQFDNTTNATYYRRMKELTWQNLLQTAHPLGFNNFTINLLEA